MAQQGQQGQDAPSDAPKVEFLVDPVNLECPNCGDRIQTKTEDSFSLIGCLFGFWLICACCCIPSLRAVKHTCPTCNTVLGRYNGQFWKTCK